jgi:integrase
LDAASLTKLYPAFLLLVLYGLRRGELLGLRWSDIDFDHNVIRIRQQVQRIRGQLIIGPTKTWASHRDLPLVGLPRIQLLRLKLETLAAADQDTLPEHDLVFRTATGHPIEPRNIDRSFECLRKGAGLQHIRLHDLRRTTATFLNKLGVPARDTQLLLGHSRISITQEIYTNVDQESKTLAVSRMERLFIEAPS